MSNEKMLHMVAFVLAMVGALNWGLVGLLQMNLVETLFGMDSMLTNLVYILVGVSAVYLLVKHKADCVWCSGKKK
jgi:uncharacterized membrane protein YuzA (DUF378 family)